MGPYMALTVPSSFYRIEAGLHALSYSPVFHVHKLDFFKEINYFQNSLKKKFILSFKANPGSVILFSNMHLYYF